MLLLACIIHTHTNTPSPLLMLVCFTNTQDTTRHVTTHPCLVTVQSVHKMTSVWTLCDINWSTMQINKFTAILIDLYPVIQISIYFSWCFLRYTITKLFYFLSIFICAYILNHLQYVQTYKPALLKASHQLQWVHNGGMGAVKENRIFKSCAEELSRQVITVGQCISHTTCTGEGSD